MESWVSAQLKKQVVWYLFLLPGKCLCVSGFGLRLASIVMGHLVERWNERRLRALTPSNRRRLPEGSEPKYCHSEPPVVPVSLNTEDRRTVALMKGENRECPGGTQRRSESARFGDWWNVVASGRECQEHELMALEIDAEYTSFRSLLPRKSWEGGLGSSRKQKHRDLAVSVARKCRGQNPDPCFRTPSRVLFSSYFLDSKAG